ncbi:hypothetical protein FK535_07905 [Mycolicibacterium sp. 018/SC-01/001]|uniref:hypothetical protein n=1 Tax=Mycolicibacterium sp. 018/SC-01/001 TaxID=2592069 RepID=UPI00117BF0DC|nr:hypothetical protein [Mycolicibacterium sp. 018/SC-01/001]TRW86370.1 hypothetical protein FK535_07905 [Mycolicibacterium sp. 018/SC-01/001]
MPDDLLRFVSGPPGYSPWWLWLAVGLVLVVIVWHAAVVVSTLPSGRLRTMPVVRDAHARLLRQRFTGRVRAIVRQHRAGELTDVAAGAALSRTLRSFLHQATGRRAQYMQLKDIAASDLAVAAPVLEALGEAQFSAAPTADIERLGADTENVIRSWA